MAAEYIVLADADERDLTHLDAYREIGGYAQLVPHVPDRLRLTRGGPALRRRLTPLLAALRARA